MSDVATLRLACGKANAMSHEVLDAIERLVDDFERGPARAAVLTGYDSYFSAGLALPTLVDLDRAAMRVFIERFGDVMLRVFACEKPIVAAINGHAIAGGYVLALMCDLRVAVADEKARLGLNETQLGIGLPAVVIEPLRAQLPPTSIVPVAIQGELFTPSAALAMGMIHAVWIDPVQFATTRAGTLAALPAMATAQVKRALRAPVIEAIQRTRAVETERWLDTWFSDEGQVRLRAAVAKIKK